jgi:uncharacterized protein YyaL (SSP411 family)
LTGRELGLRVAEETADFMLAELRTPEGGFASSLDADTDGSEGAYYVWTPDELRQVLGDADGEWVAGLLSVTSDGTFEHGSSTLQLRQPPDDDARWRRVRELLLRAREKRARPARDDKVVAAWNGLAIAALAEIAKVTRRPDLLDAASESAELLWSLHWSDQRLLRVSRDGVASSANGVLEDYGDVAEGFLNLYQATSDQRWYVRALDILDSAIARFSDDHGGFFDTPSDGEALVRRPQDATDNATPSGQSALAGALLTAAALSGELRYRDVAEVALLKSSRLALSAPRFAGWWLAVIEAWLDGPREVAIVGEPGEERDALEMLVWEWPSPGRVVAVAGAANGEPVPLLRDRRPLRGPTVYVCRNFVCEVPTSDPVVVGQLLRGAAEPRSP